jgi:hypothetical protein
VVHISKSFPIHFFACFRLKPMNPSEKLLNLIELPDSAITPTFESTAQSFSMFGLAFDWFINLLTTGKSEGG